MKVMPSSAMGRSIESTILLDVLPRLAVLTTMEFVCQFLNVHTALRIEYFIYFTNGKNTKRHEYEETMLHQP